MATFNILEAAVTCPHCGCESSSEVEFRFGVLDLGRYRLGDKLSWRGGGRSEPKARPPGGDYDGEGYAECPHCHRDFWLDIRVRNDLIESAEVNPTRPGYIQPSSTANESGAC